MKRNAWYSVKYTDEKGYFHDDLIRGLAEAKRAAKRYNGIMTEAKFMKY